MKKLVWSFLTFFFTLSVPAQSIRYPAEVAAVFEESDRILSDCPVSSRVAEGPCVICIYTSSGDQASDYASDVLRQGMIPIVLPLEAGGDPVITIDAVMSAASGVIFSDDAVRTSDRYSLLAFKSACDWNVPVLGDNALMQNINKALLRRQNPASDMQTLVKQATLYRKARLLQRNIFLLDTHSDLPDLYPEGFSLGKRGTNQVSLRKMEEGGLDGTFLIAYQGQNDRPDSEGPAYCFSTIRKIREDIGINGYRCGVATAPSDALALQEDGKRAFFIGIENGKGIGDDLRNVEKAAAMGVRYITLSHTYDNLICHSSSHSADTTLGLTPFGRQVVAEMNRCGILVDCSHTSSGTFWDCIALSKAPIICSHSGAKQLFRHDRNITDEQLRALRDNGGVIQVYAVWNFQSRNRDVDIETYLDHIDHCVKVAGIDHVGIGIDMDGGGGYTGVFGANDAVNITMGLLERGYSEEDIAKIWSGNLFRVLDRVAAVAKEMQK